MTTNLEKSALSDSLLDAWLLAATRGLCDEACRRIWAEVRTHVADSVRGLCAEGMNDDVAYEEAVRQLGSPRVARRRFRATELTEREYAWLKRDTKPTVVLFRTRWSVLIAILGWEAFLFSHLCFWSGDYSSVDRIRVILACQFVVAAMVSLRASAISCIRGDRRRAVFAQFCLYFSVCLALLAMPVLNPNDLVDQSMHLIYFGLPGWLAFRTAYLWFKLRRVALDRIGLG